MCHNGISGEECTSSRCCEPTPWPCSAVDCRSGHARLLTVGFIRKVNALACDLGCEETCCTSPLNSIKIKGRCILDAKKNIDVPVL
eukprot:Awhi_evm1s6462